MSKLTYERITARAEQEMVEYLAIAEAHRVANDRSRAASAWRAALGVLSMWKVLARDFHGADEAAYLADCKRLAVLICLDIASLNIPQRQMQSEVPGMRSSG